MSTALLRRALPPRATASFSSSSSAAAASSSSSSSTDEDDDVVSAAVSVLTHQRSRTRWSNLRSLFPTGFTPSQITRILIKIRNNPRLAHSFFNFSSKYYSLPSQCYAPIIHIVTRAHLKTRAQTLIKDAIRVSNLDDDDQVEMKMKKRPKIFRELVDTYTVCNSIPLVFDLLIEGLLEGKKLDPCVEIVRLLRSRSSFQPQIRTCNALISTASRVRGSDFGYELYRELFGFDHHDDDDNCRNVMQHGFKRKLGPNVCTFNALMSGFRRDRVVDMVEEVWIEMAKLNVGPTVCSYGILMAAYCDEGAIEKARNVWEDMKEKGLRPDVACYNTLIGGYCRIGEIEKAEELYTEMGLAGLSASEVTYQHLVNGYCVRRDVDNCMVVYRDMCVKGFSPCDATVNTMVGLLCEKGSVSEAFELFVTVMKKNAEFVAKESSFVVLIKGLCGEGKMEDALQIQAQMMGKGFKPGSEVYEAFVEGYTKLGMPDMAQRLREEMEEFITPD